MRRTSGKSGSDPVCFGDEARASVLADALLASDDVERWTHGFHTYPAGLHPDAAALLVSAFEGDRVLDPFCGGGTVLVEAQAAGRRALGRDLSPVAMVVSGARTSFADEAHLTRVRSAARKMTAAARAATESPPQRIAGTVREWYAPFVMLEIESLRRGVSDADPELQPLLRACLSSILIKVSWRKSDTSPQRVKHDRKPGTAAVLFHKKVRELGRRIASYREAVDSELPVADLQVRDARTINLRTSVHLALTSPPYPSTYDYLPIQHLRDVWLGFDAGRGEIGARRYWRQSEREAQSRWVADTHEWTRSVAQQLEPGGHLVVVIGDGLTPGGEIDTSAPTEAAAKAAGLVSVARASVERVDHARGTTRWEHAFAFRR